MTSNYNNDKVIPNNKHQSKHQNNYKLMQSSRQIQGNATVYAETDRSETYFTVHSLVSQTAPASNCA